MVCAGLSFEHSSEEMLNALLDIRWFVLGIVHGLAMKLISLMAIFSLTCSWITPSKVKGYLVYIDMTGFHFELVNL